MVIILMLPGSPVPEWLGFLAPLIALVLLMKGGQWLYHWYRQRKFHHIHREHDPSAHDGGRL